MRRIDKEKARLLVRGGSQKPTHINKPNELSEKARLLRERRLQSGASVQPNEPSERARHLRERRQLRVSSPDASVRRDEPSSGASSIYSFQSQADYSKQLENVMDAADRKF